MNLRNSLLYLLFLSSIQCYHWDGDTLYDLEYQGSDFEAEAAAWTSSVPLVTAGVKTSQYNSTSILGGYNIMGGASYDLGNWSRTYSDLPAHNTIVFIGNFYLIDNWETYNDHFHLYFDSLDVPMWWIYSDYTNYASADLSGNQAYKDLGLMTIVFTVPHTASTLTFAVANHFAKTSDQQSMGFRNIYMSFGTLSQAPPLACAGAFGNHTDKQKVCTCDDASSFMSPVNSGFCTPCNSSSGACNGPKNTSCTSCKDSEYYYEYEKQCYPTCESPYNVEVVDGAKFCRLEVSLSQVEVKKIQYTAASMHTQGQVLGGGIKAAGVINSNSPSSALLAGLSSMMQYIRYMKINFPPKVQMLFMVSARNPISLGFGVKMPSFIRENLSNAPLPYAFDKYKISSNFVSNLWDFMVSLALMLLGILVLAILKTLTSGSRTVHMVVARVLQILKWNFPIMMICGSSGDIVFFASLQLRSSPFTSVSSTICCIVSILMMMLVVLLLTMAFKIARGIRRGVEASKWKGFEILFVQYEEKSFFSLAYMFLFLSRNIIFNLTLATLFEYPLVECIIINVCNFAMISYLLYLRPLKDLLALVQLWINEGLLNVLSINILILGILDYLGIEQKTTRDGMEKTILIVIKTFNFAGLTFMGLGVLIFIRSIHRIWKTRQAKDIRSPLQMFNFLFFGNDKKEEVRVGVENGNTCQEVSKNNVQIEKDLRENNNNSSTMDLKGDTSFICDTTIIQDLSTKTEFIRGEQQVTDLEKNNQPKNLQGKEEDNNNVALAFGRSRRFKVKRGNRIFAEIPNVGLKNDEDAENKLWFSRRIKLKVRPNRSSQKADLTFETNINLQ